MNRLGDTSAFVIPAGQLLLTQRGKTRIYTVGIVFEFYKCPFNSNTKEEMQQCVHHFSRACDNFGFTISTKKTQVRHQPAPRKMYHKPHIFVNVEPLEASDSFNYLGGTLSRDANIVVEFNNILSKAISAFGRLRKKVWERRGISQDTKLNVFMDVVLTVLLQLYIHFSIELCIAVTPENTTTSIQQVCGLS